MLVSDFYAAYNHYPGLKQRCWVHLLRDIRELEALYPKDAGLSRWAESVRRLYGRAKTGAMLATRGRAGHGEAICCRCVVPSRMTRWHRKPSSAVA